MHSLELQPLEKAIRRRAKLDYHALSKLEDKVTDKRISLKMEGRGMVHVYIEK